MRQVVYSFYGTAWFRRKKILGFVYEKKMYLTNKSAAKKMQTDDWVHYSYDMTEYIQSIYFPLV